MRALPTTKKTVCLVIPIPPPFPQGEDGVSTNSLVPQGLQQQEGRRREGG